MKLFGKGSLLVGGAFLKGMVWKAVALGEEVSHSWFVMEKRGVF